MTESVVNGTLIALKVDGTEVAKSQSSTLSINMQSSLSITKAGGKWVEQYPQYLTWSVKGSGLVVYDDTISHFDLFSYMINKTKITVRFSTEVNGDKYFQGSGYIIALSKDAPVEANATFKFNITGTGELTGGTVTVVP